MLKFSLSLRIYSPKIEAYRQIALDRGIQNSGDECDTVVDINGHLVCDVSQIENSIRSASQENVLVFDIDHIYSAGALSKVCSFPICKLKVNYHNMGIHCKDIRINFSRILFLEALMHIPSSTTQKMNEKNLFLNFTFLFLSPTSSTFLMMGIG